MINLPQFKQALLPDAEIDAVRTIEKMDYGDSGWTVPWAMYADTQRRMWLHGSYDIHPATGGTVQMRVSRTAEGLWVVDASECSDSKWEPRKNPGYAGEFNPIAVADVVWPRR